MKKILIAFAAVAIATVVNAATYNWSVYTTSQSWNGYAATTTGSANWTGVAIAPGLQYFLVDAGVYTQGDLLTVMRAGEDWSSAVLVSGTTGSDAKIAATKFTTTSDASDYTLSAYVVLLKDDYAYFSASQKKTGDASGGQVDFAPTITTSKILRDTDGTTAYGTAGWYNAAAAVPEPTSGLLLLLGVAGLALRRKRA